MSSRRVAEFDNKCLETTHDVDTDPYAIQFRPQVFEEMRDQGYPVEDVLTLYTNVSLKDDGNDGYIVGEIETLRYPLDHELCEATDTVTMWFCTGPHWNYRLKPKFSEGERPVDSEDCDHIKRCKRKERRAIDDESQTDLGELE